MTVAKSGLEPDSIKRPPANAAALSAQAGARRDGFES